LRVRTVAGEEACGARGCIALSSGGVGARRCNALRVSPRGLERLGVHTCRARGPSTVRSRQLSASPALINGFVGHHYLACAQREHSVSSPRPCRRSSSPSVSRKLNRPVIPGRGSRSLYGAGSARGRAPRSNPIPACTSPAPSDSVRLAPSRAELHMIRAAGPGGRHSPVLAPCQHIISWPVVG